MCGIAGIVAPEAESMLRPLVQAMTDQLAHRGPDQTGQFVADGVGLGHRRLSILDLSEAGRQPMYAADGRYVMVYNGELYNYEALKAELPDYPYQSDTDSEVILAAFQTWGPACVKRFNGMFALAIWDTVTQSLFVVRDRLGIKPLYYYRAADKLIFASEVRALLASEQVPRKLNHAAIPEYLRYYSVNTPYTLIEGVNLLPPGSYATFDGKEWKITRYWNLATAGEESLDLPYEQYQQDVKRLLSEAVTKRMMSDVPLGAFLSGGIDSSAIVALMSTNCDTQVHSFSVVFEEKAFDESPYSDLIAQTYNTVHHKVKLRPGDFLDQLPEALQAMDHPSGDGLNSYVVSQATKQAGFTVALSGLGGDELFAGYPVFTRYANMHRYKALYRVPRGLRQVGGSLVGTLYRNHKTARLKELLSLVKLDFPNLYPIFRQIHSETEIDTLLAAAVYQPEKLGEVFSAADIAAIRRLPLLSQVSVGEIGTYTQHVLLRDTDQMSMAHALEVRVPFFDHELVEYVLRIPDTAKYPDFAKKLLVESLGALLPHEIVHRPKMGFMFPWTEWLKGPLKSFCQSHIEHLAERGILDGDHLLRTWEGFVKGESTVTWIKIWMLVVLESWMQTNQIDA